MAALLGRLWTTVMIAEGNPPAVTGVSFRGSLVASSELRVAAKLMSRQKYGIPQRDESERTVVVNADEGEFVTDKEPDTQDRMPVDDDPWWAGLGPVGGGVLVLLGLAIGAFVLLRDSDSADDLPHLYGSAKVVAIGLVVGGTALFARRRDRNRPK
ncbi:hypothetical protein ACFVT2_14455 [Streptomyces sp. NPDC058000]|uniref:hypothetical protein n=1 Tax=Streptomyces sp. NPDC058000 TaxID=3346299 RepID=UPI0036E490E0